MIVIYILSINLTFVKKFKTKKEKLKNVDFLIDSFLDFTLMFNYIIINLLQIDKIFIKLKFQKT